MPREEAEAWARSKGMLFLEASAKTQVAIKQVFTEVVRKVSAFHLRAEDDGCAC